MQHRTLMTSQQYYTITANPCFARCRCQDGLSVIYSDDRLVGRLDVSISELTTIDFDLSAQDLEHGLL